MTIGVLLVDEVCRGRAVEVAGCEIVTLQASAPGFYDRLRELEARWSELSRAGDMRGCICFVTINAAFRIRSSFPFLRSGLFLADNTDPGSPSHLLWWHNYTSRLPAEWLLNPSGVVFTPRGAVSAGMQQLSCEQVFVRPLSPWKPLAGFAVATETLPAELSAHVGLNSALATELLVACPGQPIDRVEWRCHAVAGEVVSIAPYSWEIGLIESRALLDEPLWQHFRTTRKAPDAVRDLAMKVAAQLYEDGAHFTDNVVIDLASVAGVPKLLELNAISTAGWYTHTAAEALISKMAAQFF